MAKLPLQPKLKGTKIRQYNAFSQLTVQEHGCRLLEHLGWQKGKALTSASNGTRNSQSLPEAAIQFQDFVFLVIISFIPLFAAQFGSGNQVEQFALIERLIDPSFAHGDIYVDSAARLGQPRFYYALLLSGFARVLTLPVTVHVFAVATYFLLGLTSFIAARRFVGASAIGGAAAATLAVLNGTFSLGLAGYLTFDSYQPANLAIALALSGVSALFLDRRFLAAGLFAGASLMHPTLGAEVAMTAFAALAFSDIVTSRSVRAVLPLIPSAMIVAMAIVVEWVLPNHGAASAKIPDRQFFDILAHMRAPHHYLGLGFPFGAWISAIIFVGASAWLIAMHHARVGIGRRSLGLIAMAVIVLAVCLASLYWVDVAENRAWITAQVFRMMLVVKWVGFIFLGWYIGQAVTAASPARYVLIIGLICISGDAQPTAMLLALLADFAILRMSLRGIVAIGVSLIIALACAFVQLHHGTDKQTVRLLAAIVIGALVYSWPAPKFRRTVAAVAVAVLFVVLGFFMRQGGAFGLSSLKGTYSWADHTEDEADIARKASAVSPPGSTWLIPPDMEAFRLLSRRAVLVDFTSIPFKDADMVEWHRRMLALYGPVTTTGFKGLHQMEAAHHDRPAFGQARQLGAGFAVLYADTPWQGRVLASNAHFKAVVIP